MDHSALADHIAEAFEAHALVRRRLADAVRRQGLGADPDLVGCDETCTFDLWLHGHSAPGLVRNDDRFTLVRGLHRRFHDRASEVADLARHGNHARASALLHGPCSDSAADLLRALTAWRFDTAPSRPARL